MASTSNTFRLAFKGKRAVLLRAIDVTEHLLNLLEDRELLTGEHVAQILGCNTDDKRVDKLLRILDRRDDRLFPDFLSALVADEQQHIVRDYFAQSAAPRFVHSGIQVSIGDRDGQSCANTNQCNAASQTDLSLIDLLTGIRSELRHLVFSNQRPVEVGVQASFDEGIDFPRVIANVADVNIQAFVEQRTDMTQTDDSFTDDFSVSTEVNRVHESVDHSCIQLNSMPLELLDSVLVRSFTKQFTDQYKSQERNHEVIQQAYLLLAAVCEFWWQRLNRSWLERRIRRFVDSIAGPFSLRSRQTSQQYMRSLVCGVAQYNNTLYVLCHGSEFIHVFGANNAQSTTIKVKGMKEPIDIVACSATTFYVAGESQDCCCVWRVVKFPDGSERSSPWTEWLKPEAQTQFRPCSLSMASGRLLVTAQFDELLLCEPCGKKITLPGKELLHARETTRGTIVVSSCRPFPQISEINAAGRIIKNYSGQLKLSRPDHFSLDSGGRVIVTDTFNDRVLLLNSSLELQRILLDKEHDRVAPCPRRVHYDENIGKLIVASAGNCFQSFLVRDKSYNVLK